MSLTGQSVPSEILSKIEPNTALMVISDKDGNINVIKIDRSTVKANEPLIRVQGGCWVPNNGGFKWVNPCP
jgi:hypothetical protein